MPRSGGEPPSDASSPDGAASGDDASLDAATDAAPGQDAAILDATTGDASGQDAGLDATTGDASGQDAGLDATTGDASGQDASFDGSSPASCLGTCVALDQTESVCSRRCVFGDTNECAPASGGLRRGGCVYVTPDGGIGDLGFCGELCDCSGDCSDPTFVCDAFAAGDLATAFARQGVCTPPALVQNRAIACDD
jgi:hypothetical protein